MFGMLKPPDPIEVTRRELRGNIEIENCLKENLMEGLTVERFPKNVLILSIFELEKCSFLLNRSEFRKNSIGTIISDLVRHPRA